MRFDIDPEADAAYLYLTNNKVATTHQIGGINIDLDENGQAVGIEILTLHRYERPPTDLLLGIAPDWCGGMSVDQYIDAIRSEE